MANAPGDGSITKLRNGRFWVRSPLKADGKRVGLGTFATKEEAEAHLVSFLCLQGTPSALPASSRTFVLFGREVLDLREDDGFRGVDKERDRFECHLADSPIAHMGLTEIGPAEVSELARWLKKKNARDKRGTRKLSTKTIRRVMSIGSSVFAEAVTRGLVVFNPFQAIKVKARPDEDEGDEIATFLSLDEQRRFVACEKIPYDVRVMFRIMIGTGIRSGEARFNYLRDLHLEATPPYLDVQWAKRKAGVDYRPKNKKARKVYLFGDALVAFREWVEIRKTYIRKAARHEAQTDEGLIFPTVTGCRRGAKLFGNGWSEPGHPRATPNGWVDRLDHFYHLAGIPWRVGLHVHAMRHTCATSLLEGLWDPEGKGWAIKDVCNHLGHSSIAVTMKYIHEVDDTRKAAATRAQASGYGLVTGGGPTPSSVAAIRNDIDGVGPAGLEPATYGLKEGGLIESLRALAADGSPSNAGLVTTLAKTVRELIAQGQFAAAASILETLTSLSQPALERKTA